MWIVELALKRPHTFIVLAIAIVIFGFLSLAKMAVDIFPVINLPVVSCVWTYQGMSAYDMENLVTTITERALTSTVNGIQRMESMSIANLSVIKIYLQMGTPVGESVAMVTSVGSAIRRQLPRGINPPFVTSSSATDVPVLQLALHSNQLNEAELFDIANNLVRAQLATVQGTKIPFPYGGKYRQVMVDLDPDALYSYGLSPYDVVNALQDQNVIAPSGTVKMGKNEYIVVLNNLPKKIEELGDFPIKTGQTKQTKDSPTAQMAAVVFLKDVANVRDGWQPQLNVVNLNGKRAVLFNVLKSGDASTISVVNGVKKLLPKIRALVPESCTIDVLIDQSLFVKDCVEEVAREALIAAGLTAIMMLALLGSWRSTLIVATSIPLAILSAIIGLNIMGQTINSMTLGGLALAVGMLVDDATVEIENVHRNMAMGKDITTAILDGAKQVALPALVSTLSICIVFVPVVFLTEPSKSLFMPMGLSVILAMLASYGLSRTLVPFLTKTLLSQEHHGEPESNKKGSIFHQIHVWIETGFEKAREIYTQILGMALNHRRIAVSMFMVLYVVSFCLTPFIGADYFPAIDSGQLRLHICAPPGTRIEVTEKIFKDVEKEIRKIIPAQEISLVTHNIGMAISGINYAYSDSQTVSEADGELLLSLDDKRQHDTFWYQKTIREALTKKFPQCTFYYQPADIVTQILNAGLPAPIDIKVAGMKRDVNFKIAQDLKRDVAQVVGVADVNLHQVAHAPHLFVQVDRTRAQPMGITQNDVSNSVLTTLSSSFQTNPTFWTNPKTGVNYNVAVQTPQRTINSMDALRTTPITAYVRPEIATNSNAYEPQLLSNVAEVTRSTIPAVVNHINVAPAYDIYASTNGRDLMGVANDVQKIVAEYKKKGKVPSGTFVVVAGQVMMMYLAFIALIGGLAFSLVLVYLLLVVNFQSWTDPLIILMAIPGAFAGIMWALFVTHTTFSIPALMGAIMTVGVASANSILMVNFAKEQLESGIDAKKAALQAGYSRFRPVIMTASAMIIGMIPMAIGSGEGGSQNAPIGRVVIGGLMVATFCTLIFVPMMFSIFRGKEAKNVDRRASA